MSFEKHKISQDIKLSHLIITLFNELIYIIMVKGSIYNMNTENLVFLKSVHRWQQGKWSLI